jgi:outer membrane protein, heavy metal efflux system
VTANGIYEPAAGAFSPWIPGLTFDLPLETAGKRRLRTEQARHLSESARFNVATAAWQVRSHLRASLVEFESARQRAALLEHQVALREELATRLESQVEAGALSLLERNTARLALVRARADLAEAQRLLSEARPHLADALGLPTAALESLSVRFDLGATGAAVALTTPEVRKLALQGRADILAALADYAAAQSALQLEIAKQYPDIHLNPGYSWNGGSTGEHDWQLGATVELPLLNRHEGPIAEAAARRQASATRFLALQARVVGEIDAATASFRASQTNTLALGALAAAQATQRQAVLDQFRAGAVDRLDVLAAELELAATDLVRFESLVKVQQALGALEDSVQRPLDLPQAIFSTQIRPQANP